jgi:ribosomal protein L28
MTSLAWAMLSLFLFVVVGNLVHNFWDAFLRKKSRREAHLNLHDTDQYVPELNEKMRLYIERTLSLEGMIDADQLAEIANEIGVTEEHIATEPCGKHCECNKAGFPVVCRRLKTEEDYD